LVSLRSICYACKSTSRRKLESSKARRSALLEVPRVPERGVRYARDGTGTAVTAHARLTPRNARTVWAVFAGGSLSGSHFDALQRRHVRRAWSTAAYFESSRVCKHVILPKELQTLPWGLESAPRSRWHPLGRGADSRSSNSVSTPFVQGRNLGFYHRKRSGTIAGSRAQLETPKPRLSAQTRSGCNDVRML
jgi:hypothetical protein